MFSSEVRFTPHFTITNRITSALTRIERARGFLEAAALGYALEHGGLTIKDFESLQPDVNRRTLQRDLKDMVEKGVFIPEGATNRLFYRLGNLDT
jgi:DNA-binding HxlR family transcriptional regulator